MPDISQPAKAAGGGQGGELKWRFLKKSQTYSRSGIKEGQRGALESA